MNYAQNYIESDISFPLTKLVGWLWSKRFAIVFLALIAGLLSAAIALKDYQQHSRILFTSPLAKVNAQPISSTLEGMAYLQGRGLAADVIAEHGDPFLITKPYLTKWQEFVAPYVDIVVPQYTGLVMSYYENKAKRMTPIHVQQDKYGQLFARYAGTQLILTPGVALETEDFILEVKAASMIPNAPYIIQPLSEEAAISYYMQRVKVDVQRLKQQQLVLKEETNPVLNAHIVTSNALEALYMAHSIVDAYRVWHQKQYAGPLADIEQSYIDQLKALDMSSDALKVQINEAQHDVMGDVVVYTKELNSLKAALSKELRQITLHRLELEQELQPKHPAMQALANKSDLLESKLKRLQTELSRIPSKRIEIEGLKERMSDLRSEKATLIKSFHAFKLGAQQSATLVQAIGEPQLVNDSVISIAVKKSIIWSAFTVLLMASWYTAIFLMRYTQRDYYYRLAEAFNLPVLAEFTYSKHHFKRKQKAPSSRKLKELQRLFSTVSEDMHYMMNVPNANMMYLTHINQPQETAWVALGSALHIIKEWDKRICVVDADMNNACLTKIMNLSNHTSLADVLFKRDSLQSAICKVDEKLDVIPASRVAMNNARLTENENFSQLIHQLQDEYDYVIAVMPPSLSWDKWYSTTAPKGVIVQHNMLGGDPEMWKNSIISLSANMLANMVLLFSRPDKDFIYGKAAKPLT